MSDESRINALNDHYYRGTLTFDQFVLGITLAATGYLAQTGTYSVIGWNQGTLGLLPLAILGVACWLGFLRIEATIHLLRVNSSYLEVCHRNPGTDFSEEFRGVQRVSERTHSIYRSRNWAILLGLLAHVALKVLLQYPIF